MASLLAWHGAHRWDGPPTVRAQDAKNVEHGPGIYLATGYDSVARYARGGGVIMLFELDPALSWLEEATLPLAGALAAARTLFGPTIGTRIGADLARHAERLRARLGGSAIDATALVNLAVNAGVASGVRGVRLAAYLAGSGIGASLVQRSRDDWIVVFDPRVIRSWRRASPEEVRTRGFDLPRIAAQLEGLRAGHP